MTVLAMLMETRKAFFFVKKKQKTFLNWARALTTARTQMIEVFFASFLFTKKKTLHCSALLYSFVRCEPEEPIIDRTGWHHDLSA
jgi:hypothetical protein